MLKKLIDFLPVSRRKYAEGLAAMTKVIDGLIEAEANHCQIEMRLIQQFQTKKMKKSAAKKSNNNTNMYG